MIMINNTKQDIWRKKEEVSKSLKNEVLIKNQNLGQIKLFKINENKLEI